MQAVLSVGLLACGATIVWLAKNLMKAQKHCVDQSEKHAEQIQQLFEDKLEKNTQAVQEQSTTNKSVSTALHRFSDVMDSFTRE